MATERKAPIAKGEIEWRDIADFAGYQVSSDGRVRRSTAFKQFPVGYELKPRLNIDGYRVTTLGRGGSLISKRIARLVARAFLGEAPSANHVVAHYDGTRTNDSVENLRWATAAENEADKRRHGTVCGAKLGSSHHNARLTEHDVVIIRAKVLRGEWRPAQAASHFAVSRPTITGILKRDTWRHI